MRVYANVPHDVTWLLKFLVAVDTLVPLDSIHLPYSTPMHKIILCHQQQLFDGHHASRH